MQLLCITHKCKNTVVISECYIRTAVFRIIILGFNIRRRQQVEDDLRYAKEELEMRVAERAVELENAVEHLHIELAERKNVEALLKEGKAHLKKAQQIAHLGPWDLDL